MLKKHIRRDMGNLWHYKILKVLKQNKTLLSQ